MELGCILSVERGFTFVLGGVVTVGIIESMMLASFPVTILLSDDSSTAQFASDFVTSLVENAGTKLPKPFAAIADGRVSILDYSKLDVNCVFRSIVSSHGFEEGFHPVLVLLITSRC